MRRAKPPARPAGSPAGPSGPARNRRAAFGLGVFETVLVHRGRPFLLDRHAARMTEGLRRIGLAPRLDPAGRIAWALEALAGTGIGDGVLRMTAVSHPDRNEEGDFAVDVEARDGRSEAGGSGEGAPAPMTALTMTGGRRPGSPLAGVKALAWAEYQLARNLARANGCDEAILLDETGRLLEGAASNLFLVIGGRLLTPPLSSGILPGVTRGLVLELARGEGLPAREEELPAALLEEAGEAFLTSALIGVAALVEVDGRRIGTGEPGPLTGRLARARDRMLEEWRLPA